MNKKSVLFLCTGNSCRSQMAEGWCRHLLGDRFAAYSAGVECHGLNPYAVKVMSEAGVDITGHKSKLIKDIENIEFDYVVTVCDNAEERCPIFPARSRMIHHSFNDPPKMAEKYSCENDKLECYRKVRDEIKDFIVNYYSNF